MNHSRLRISSIACAAAISLGTVGLTESTAGASTGVVPKSTVESQSAKILASETGQALPKVICKSGLKAKIGASIHCKVVPHGSKLVYPAIITVKSIHGTTAFFHVQLGQAAGQANKARACGDNATINAALTAASTPQAFVSALEAQEKTILDFQSTAPSAIVSNAAILVQAARQAISSGDPSAFTGKTVSQAVAAIDQFCGQTADG
jgi:hypothetical protein